MRTVDLFTNYDIQKDRQKWKPKDYYSSILPGTDYIDINQELERVVKQTPHFMPIMGVKSGIKSYRTKQPIRVHVAKDGEQYFAENDNLLLFGAGSTVMEAIDDFIQHVMHFWQYYNELTYEQVTGDAIRLKKIYEELLIEE